MLGGSILQATAGELQLTNGDVLKGELVRMQAQKVYWKSESFGELVIDKTKVAELQTAVALKFNGHSDPCRIEGMQGGELQYHCEQEGAEPVMVSTPLLSLRAVDPYIAFAEGAYEYDGRFKLAGTYATGNTEEQDWDVSSRTSYRRGEFRHVVTLDYESESETDNTTQEFYEGKYRLDWFFKEQWFWYNETSLSADDSLNLDESYLLGTGLGYELWKTSEGYLDLETGLVYTKDLYGNPVGTDLDDYVDVDEQMGLRYATDFKYPIFGSSSLIHKNELLYSLEDSADWQFSADTGINVPLGAGLFSEFLLEYDYDNLPRGETKKDDVKLTVGIGYDW